MNPVPWGIIFALNAFATLGKQLSGSLNPNVTNSSNATYNVHKLEIWFDSSGIKSEHDATVTC